jgi:hypothetical protein
MRAMARQSAISKMEHRHDESKNRSRAEEPRERVQRRKVSSAFVLVIY